MLKSRLPVACLFAGLLPTYAAEFMTGQAARAVIGQATFVTQDTLATEKQFGGVGGLAFAGNTLFATDANRIGLGTNNNRVLMFGNILDELPSPFAEIPPSTGRCPLCIGRATTVLGTKNADGVPIADTSQAGMRLPTGVASDGTAVAVADTANNRVLLWTSMPTTAGQKADFVVGQADFTTQLAPPISASSLRGPQGVWIQNRKLFVADTGNNRVLIWNSLPTRNNQPADLVLGQPNFTTSSPQNIINLTLETSAANLLSPTSVTSDGTRLFVADLGFNRVLIWRTIPTQTQQPADIEVGQKDMTVSLANDSANLCLANGADSNNNPTYPARCERTLNFPRYALSDGQRLFIADGGNDRVLVYNSIPTANAAAADVVLGQPDAASDVVTNPTGFIFSANPTTISAANVTPTPTSLAWDGTNLYVADATDYRVLIFTPAEPDVAPNGAVNFASREIFALGTFTIGGKITAGNVVSVTISSSSANITVTPSGPSLIGGSSTTKATGTAVVAGAAFNVGTAVTLTINNVTYTYKTISGDTINSIATALANVINQSNSGAGDPKVTASSSDATVTLTARSEGTAGNSITLNGNAYSYTVRENDTLEIVAKALANVINTANGGAGDPNVTALVQPNLPLIVLVARAAGEAGNNVSIASAATTGTVTITATASGSTLTGGNSSNRASGSVTIAGTGATAGNVVNASIQGVNYTYSVVTGDTLTTIATGLANAINGSNSGAGDPNVTASTSSAVVTFTARNTGDAGNSLTLSSTASAAGSTTATPSSSTLTGGANAGNLAPGAFLTIRGLNLADFAAAADQSSQQLPWELAGVQVYVDGNRAPLFYASPTAINAQMPWEVVNSSSVSVYVRTKHANGNVTVTNAIGSPINPASPGLFASGDTEPRVAQAYHASSFATGTVTITGTIQTGDIPQITINDRSYTYTVTAGTTITLTARSGGTAGNSITMSGGISSGGTTTVTATTPTLTGGADGVQATGALTIGGTVTAGNVATVTINGTAHSYTVVSGDTLGTITLGLQNAINSGGGDPNVTASITGGDTLQVISQKLADAINGNPEETVTANTLSVGTGVRLTAKLPGPEGNGIPIAVSATTATTNTSGALVVVTAANSVTCCANIAGAPVTRANPAVAGETIFVYGTGLGLVCTPGNFTFSGVTSGECTPPDPAKDALITGGQYLGPAVNVPTTSVNANVGGGTTTTVSAGIVPGTFGVYQVIVQLPQSLNENAFTPIYLQQSFSTSNIATIPVGPPLQ